MQKRIRSGFPAIGRLSLSRVLRPVHLACVLALGVLVAGHPGTARAQRETFLVNNMDSGGFAEASVQATVIDRHVGMLVGGAGGWILNRRLVVGPAVYWLATSLPLSRVPILGDRTPSLALVYGGVMIEWISNPRKRTHTTMGVLVGAGGVAYNESGYETAYDDEDAFIVLEPTISLEANLNASSRVGARLKYRLVGALDLEGLKDSTLSGVGIGLYVKLGGF
jgi:hypothetical protein